MDFISALVIMPGHETNLLKLQHLKTSPFDSGGKSQRMSKLKASKHKSLRIKVEKIFWDTKSPRPCGSVTIFPENSDTLVHFSSMLLK